MNAEASWVACLDAADAGALASLRLVPGLEIAPLADAVWLRGPTWNDVLAQALRLVPGLRRFTVDADRQLFAEGARVPGGCVPLLRWEPLRDWLPVAFPAALGAGKMDTRAPLRLVRSTAERPANAVLTDIRAWLAWAAGAAEIRLRPLRFAAAWDDRVWIEGTPPPALAGQHFHLSEGVAVPCGFACEPDPGARVLRRWLALAEGDTACAHADGRWQILKAEQFVPALRSAARLTAEVLGHE